MQFLTELWLPILLSAVFVFIVSSIIHMALPIHKGDYRGLPNEATVLASLRATAVQPGTYAFPYCGSMKEMGSPEMVEKMKSGPCGYLTIRPAGAVSIGRSLVWWFIFSLIIGVFVAYIGWHGLGVGAGYLDVFQITGAAAVLGYAVGHMHDSIWKSVSWSTTGKFIFDGVIYALVTAGTFGWLWPDAITIS